MPPFRFPPLRSHPEWLRESCTQGPLPRPLCRLRLYTGVRSAALTLSPQDIQYQCRGLAPMQDETPTSLKAKETSLAPAQERSALCSCGRTGSQHRTFALHRSKKITSTCALHRCKKPPPTSALHRRKKITSTCALHRCKKPPRPLPCTGARTQRSDNAARQATKTDLRLAPVQELATTKLRPVRAPALNH